MSKDDKTALLKARFLEYFKKVPIQKFAGLHIGRNEDTICIWKKEDSDFSDCIDKLKAEYVKRQLSKVRSPEWILERVMKGDFSPRNELVGDMTVNIIKRSYLEDGRTT